jgi:hypothetical protein
MKKLSIILVALAFIFGTAFVAEAGGSPSFPDIVCDLVLMRPVCVVGVGIGLVVTVVAMPFALPTGTMDQVSQTLIVEPFDYAFVRPLGDWQDK